MTLNDWYASTNRACFSHLITVLTLRHFPSFHCCIQSSGWFADVDARTRSEWSPLVRHYVDGQRVCCFLELHVSVTMNLLNNLWAGALWQFSHLKSLGHLVLHDVPCGEFVPSLCLRLTHVFRSSNGNTRRPTDVIRERRHSLRHRLFRPVWHLQVTWFCVITSCFVNRADSLFLQNADSLVSSVVDVRQLRIAGVARQDSIQPDVRCFPWWPSSHFRASGGGACRSWSGTCGLDMFCSDKTGTLTQYITDIESEFPWWETSEGKIVVVCTASFETDPRAVDVIDTMLFKCRQEIRLLSTVTRPHFLKIRFDRWDYALFTILPRALGTEVFRGRSDLNIGAGRWLWSDRPLAVGSVKTSHYPTHGAEHSIHPGRRRGTYFQGAWISILAWENMCSAFCSPLVHFAFMMRFIG